MTDECTGQCSLCIAAAGYHPELCCPDCPEHGSYEYQTRGRRGEDNE